MATMLLFADFHMFHHIKLLAIPLVHIILGKPIGIIDT